MHPISDAHDRPPSGCTGWARSETRRLLAAARRRLGRRAAAAAIPAGLWLAVALLAAAALDHVRLGLGGTRALCLAALAVVLAPAVAAAWRGRPSWQEAARQADRWYGGQSLLTSAVDQWQREADRRAGAAPLVFARAEEASARWRRTRPALAGPVPARRWWPQTALLAVAAFALLLPPAPRSAATTGADSRAAAQTAPPGDAGLDAWTAPAGSDPAGRLDSPRRPRVPDRGEAVSDGPAPSLARQVPARDREDLVSGDDSAVRHTGLEPGPGRGGREAGIAPGLVGGLSGPQAGEEIAAAPVRPVPIPLPDRPDAGSSRAGGVPLSGEGAPPAAGGPAPSHRAAAGYGGVAAADTAVDPAVRGYAAAYMQRIRDVE